MKCILVLHSKEASSLNWKKLEQAKEQIKKNYNRQHVQLILVRYISCLSGPAIERDTDEHLKFYLVGIKGMQVLFLFLRG